MTSSASSATWKRLAEEDATAHGALPAVVEAAQRLSKLPTAVEIIAVLVVENNNMLK